MAAVPAVEWGRDADACKRAFHPEVSVMANRLPIPLGDRGAWHRLSIQSSGYRQHLEQRRQLLEEKHPPPSPPSFRPSRLKRGLGDSRISDDDSAATPPDQAVAQRGRYNEFRRHAEEIEEGKLREGRLSVQRQLQRNRRSIGRSSAGPLSAQAARPSQRGASGVGGDELRRRVLAARGGPQRAAGFLPYQQF
eukprot:gene44260-4717_t